MKSINLGLGSVYGTFTVSLGFGVGLIMVSLGCLFRVMVSLRLA